MPMNLSQTRVVDPVLTKIAVDFRNEALIGDLLLPRVPVDMRAGKVVEFGKEAFHLYNTLRAPGAAVKEIEIGYENKPFALMMHSLAGKVPVEKLQEAAKGPGVDLGSRSVLSVMGTLSLGAEKYQANLIRNPATYPTSHVRTLSGVDQWTDAGSDPVADIDGGKEAVRSNIGRYPNTLALGPAAFNALKNHPKTLERFKYTSSTSITPEMLAALLDIKNVVVGKAIYTDDIGVSQDIWGGDAILAYVPESASKETPAFGYTYVLTGTPVVEASYFRQETKSWIFPTTYEYSPEVVCQDAGYLLQSVA